jgi:hypothetical protein
MSREQDRTHESNGRSMAEGMAQKAAAQVEEGALRGATVVSQMAHRAADQVDKTTEYLSRAGKWTLNTAKDTSKGIQTKVNQNPIPIIVAAAAIGIGVGYCLRRRSA